MIIIGRERVKQQMAKEARRQKRLDVPLEKRQQANAKRRDKYLAARATRQANRENKRRVHLKRMTDRQRGI